MDRSRAARRGPEPPTPRARLMRGLGVVSAHHLGVTEHAHRGMEPPVRIRFPPPTRALRRKIEPPSPDRPGKDEGSVRYFGRLPTTTIVVLGLPYTHGWQALTCGTLGLRETDGKPRRVFRLQATNLSISCPIHRLWLGAPTGCPGLPVRRARSRPRLLGPPHL